MSGGLRVEEMVPTILPPMPGEKRECHFLNWRVGDAQADPEMWHWVSFDTNGQRWFCSCPSKERQSPFPCEHLARVRFQLLAEREERERWR
jgi:hypothetical protein